METRNRVESSETFISEEYLRNRAHMRLCVYFYEFLWIVGDIDLLEYGTDGSEEIFCLDAVWTVILGVESEHRKYVKVKKKEEDIPVIPAYAGILVTRRKCVRFQDKSGMRDLKQSKKFLFLAVYDQRREC